MEGGEAIERNPQLPIANTITSMASNDQSQMNYQPNMGLPTFDHPQLQQVPLDIDWVSLLSGPPTATVVASSSNNGGGGGGCGGRESEGVDCMNRSARVGGRRSSNKKSTTPPRFAFHTRSVDDVLDDGYKWRKYGQKAVKNSNHPRSYYRCTYHTCNVKKQIQRLSKDTAIVVTTYEGIHNHPSEKLMETLTPLLRQLQFLSQF